MSTVFQAAQDEVSGSHVVHLSFALMSLTMALFSLYLDLRFFFGWQNGAWLFKATHWSLILTIAFLAVSVADAISLGWLLAGPRRWLMYSALVLSIAVDMNYFAVLVPQRILRMRGGGKHKPLASVSPVSTHKHVLNLVWILGDAGTYVLPRNPDMRHKPLELLLCGVLVPMLIFGSYLTLAYAIKSRKNGPKVLRAMGIPVADDDPRRMSVRRRSARRREDELLAAAKLAAAAAAAAEDGEVSAALDATKTLKAPPSALTVASLAVANARRPSTQRPAADSASQAPSSVGAPRRGSVKRESVKRRSVKRGGASEADSWEFDDDVEFDDFDDDASSISSFSVAQDDLTRRVKPGRWIFQSFQYRKLRTLFLLQPIIYGPVAWGALELAEGLLVGRPPLQIAALALVTVVTPLLYGPELWERSKATLFQAVLQVRRDFVTLSTYISESGSAFWQRHKAFLLEVQARMEERAAARRERIKKLIPKIKNAVATTLDATAFVVKEVSLYLWRNMSDVAAGVRDFLVGSIPAFLRYSRKVVRGLGRMVWRDIVDGVAEVYEWIDAVELEEHE